jgi:hypothetical protein
MQLKTKTQLKDCNFNFLNVKKMVRGKSFREKERDLSVEVVSWIGEITMQVGEETLAVGR